MYRDILNLHMPHRIISLREPLDVYRQSIFILCYVINAKTLKVLITGVGNSPHESVISDPQNHLHPVPRFSQ